MWVCGGEARRGIFSFFNFLLQLDSAPQDGCFLTFLLTKTAVHVPRADAGLELTLSEKLGYSPGLRAIVGGKKEIKKVVQ